VGLCVPTSSGWTTHTRFLSRVCCFLSCLHIGICFRSCLLLRGGDKYPFLSKLYNINILILGWFFVRSWQTFLSHKPRDPGVVHYTFFFI